MAKGIPMMETSTAHDSMAPRFSIDGSCSSSTTSIFNAGGCPAPSGFLSSPGLWQQIPGLSMELTWWNAQMRLQGIPNVKEFLNEEELQLSAP